MSQLVQRLQLENFGCFPRQALELAPLTFLVGPNDSGKSTLLNAVRALVVEARGVGADSVGKALGFERMLWSGAEIEQDKAVVDVQGTLPSTGFQTSPVVPTRPRRTEAPVADRSLAGRATTGG